MIVHFKISALRQSRWSEYMLRFVLGGLATVAAGVVADAYGPEVGGLFLALPAIFCASATLIEKHERERKESAGLRGRERGRQAAALDAAGACLGGVALAMFGAVVWVLAEDVGLWSLALATILWLTISTLLWWARHYLRVVRTSSR